jgi:iron complex outermembrane recepter protein
MRSPSRFVFLLGIFPAFLAAQPSPEATVKLEPVVVEDRLLTETPATVTSVDLAGEPVADITTSTLSARSANFFIADGGAQSFTDIFSLRGLTNTPLFGDPAVSFYLDDLPLGSGFTFPVDLQGFSRAELHRGPTQNTVYGNAGSAGVVTLLTPEAGATATGDLRASYGNYNAWRVSADASTASTGPADMYVSAGHFSRDGYITNTQLGYDIDGKNDTSGLARVRFRPSSTVELTLLATALRARDGVQPLVPLGGPLYTVQRDSEGLTDLDAWNAALTAAVALPFGRLTETTSFNHWDLGPYTSTLDFGFADLINNVSQQQRNWHQEVKLASDPKSAVRWQVGAIYTDGRTDGAFQRLFGPYPYEDSNYQIDSQDLAGYGEATWKLNPMLSLTAGLRVEDVRKSMDRHERVPTVQVFDLHNESTAALPKLGLSYTPDHQTNFFATVGAGYKPGGFSAFTGEQSLASFGPERTATIEAGVTRTSVDKTLSTTARVFYYDIRGYQIERSFATGSSGNEYLDVNAPKARSFGGELEFAWRPVDGLTLAVDLGYTDVTLREFTDPYTGISYAGNRAPAVPVYDADLRADYQSTGGFFYGVEVSSNGRTYYTEAEDLEFGQKAYALLSAHVGYAQGRYRVTVYGDNLTGTDYYSSITPGTNHGTPGAPRTYGVEAGLKF